MNSTLEFENGAVNIEEGNSGVANSIELHAKVVAIGMPGDIITVATPTPSTFSIAAGASLPDVPVLTVPFAEFLAFDGENAVPVVITSCPTIGAPADTPHVRIILTNAIITADPHLQIFATIEALNTKERTIDLITPIGWTQIVATEVKVDFKVYDVVTSNFTALDGSGSVPVYVADHLLLGQPMLPGVTITLTEVICTPG